MPPTIKKQGTSTTTELLHTTLNEQCGNYVFILF